MRWKLLLILVPLAAIVVIPSCLFTVDRTEFVYLTQFGKHLQTFDGGKDAEAGLHVKWPWPIQTVRRLDRRLQYFDLPGAELLTRDPKRNTIDRTLTLDAYICWRISDASGVDLFVRSVGTPEGAQAILGQRIGSELGAAIGQMELDDLINPDPRKVEDARRRLRRRLLQGGTGSQALESLAEAEYGIVVVDIRLRRSNHPSAVRDSIFQRIASERKKKAADYESEGIRLADDIKSKGARRVAELKAEADARAIELRGQADAEADRIRSEAQSKDPIFYTFLKKMEEYQRFLGDNKSTLLLSTHRELFDVLFNPPTPGKKSDHENTKKGKHEKEMNK